MNTMSPEQVALALGTSRKRVQAAARALGLVEEGAHQRTRFTIDQAEELARRLGVTPSVDGLSRIESLALAELARRPLGLNSARAVARAAGLSVAAAAKAVDQLHKKGLVTVTDEVRALGRAEQVAVIRANVLHPDWTRLAGQLRRVRSPERPDAGSHHLPRRLRHNFWNLDDRTFKNLDSEANGVYIADRALTTKDPSLMAYAVATIAPSSWAEAARGRGRNAADRVLAESLASEGGSRG
jgi:hypothetical protein